MRRRTDSAAQGNLNGLTIPAIKHRIRGGTEEEHRISRQTESAAHSSPRGLTMPAGRHRIRRGTEEQQARNRGRTEEEQKGSKRNRREVADRERGTKRPDLLDDACNQAQDQRRKKRGTEVGQRRNRRGMRGTQMKRQAESAALGNPSGSTMPGFKQFSS